MQEELSQIFERGANEEFHNSSPLYEHLSLAIAKDPEILSLAAHCRKGERAPNLFLAVVHLLLLKVTSLVGKKFSPPPIIAKSPFCKLVLTIVTPVEKRTWMSSASSICMLSRPVFRAKYSISRPYFLKIFSSEAAQSTA